jgi:hypothetical protein
MKLTFKPMTQDQLARLAAGFYAQEAKSAYGYLGEQFPNTMAELAEDEELMERAKAEGAAGISFIMHPDELKGMGIVDYINALEGHHFTSCAQLRAFLVRKHWCAPENWPTPFCLTYAAIKWDKDTDPIILTFK